jgi:hypothetical protein
MGEKVGEFRMFMKSFFRCVLYGTLELSQLLIEA